KERAALQQEFSALSGELTRIAETTAFGGKKLLDGSMGNTSFQIGSNANETVSFGLSSVSASALKGTFSSAKVAGDVSTLSASVTGAANKFSSAGTGAQASIRTGAESATDVSAAFTSGGLAADGVLNLNGENIDLAQNDSLEDVVGKINAATADTGVAASVNDDGELVLSSEHSFTVAGTAAEEMGLVNAAATPETTNAAFNKPELGVAGNLVLNVGGTTTSI